MLIRALADLHGHLPDIPPCDLLILAGDICPDYLPGTPDANHPMSNGEPQQARWLDTEFRAWLNRIPAAHVVGVAGNHDFVFEHPDMIPDGLRWTYLEDSLHIVPGHDVRIWGTPWVPHLHRWAFHASQNTLEARLQNLPDVTDILVTHSPPYGAGDLVGTSRVGDRALAKHLAHAEHKPDMIFCGHIHEARGKHWCHGVPVYNCSLVDVSYRPVHTPVTITYQ